ncbi:hypothetical protein ACFQS7_25365 [Dankookia sp. GCM10030260]
MEPLRAAPLRPAWFFPRGLRVLDFLLLALGAGAFGLLAAYVAGCGRV